MTTWPISPLISHNDLQTSISNMPSSNDDTSYYLQEWPEPFERTLLTVLTMCLYHPSSSILHSLHFPPFSFIYLLLPSFSSCTFHFSLSLTFILINSTSFKFIHTHCMSLTFNSSTYIGLPDLPSSSPISLLPPSFTFIYLH